MPLSRRARIRIALLSVLALAAVYLAVCTSLERTRIRRQAAAAVVATRARRHVDRAALLNDLRTLGDPALQGRRTGTPGGLRARALIAAQMAAAGLAPLAVDRIEPFRFVHTSIRGYFLPGRPFRTAFDNAANVIGRTPGREGSRQFVVSAHYDHLGTRDGVVYPGADDNASGVAAMLAAARVIAAARLRHPVVFAAFDAEELGLQGARAFVERHAVSAETTAIDLNLDMVSRSDTREIFVAGTSRSPWLVDVVKDVQARTPVRLALGHDRPMYLAGLVEDWTHSSDHGAFADRGVPYVYFGVEDHADYHRPTDTVDKIDPAFFADVADAVVETVLALDRVLP
jgi:hypothetical protein